MAPHLIVGVDGSANAAAALRHGIELARAQGWDLLLLYAQEHPVAPAGAAGEVRASEVRASEVRAGEVRAGAAGPDLAGLLAQVRASAPGLAVHARRLTGDPVAALIAESVGAAGVVVGVHGGHGVRGGRLGAVGTQVALRASCPVTVVPLRSPADGPVVVGVDGVRDAGFAMWYAMDTAAAYGTELVAVHAWAPPVTPRPRRPGTPVGAFAQAQRSRQDHLDREVRRWRPVFPDVEVQTRLLPGDPAATLIAASARARLLVLGVREPRSGRDPRVAAVALRVLDQAPCPVVLAHPGQLVALAAPATPSLAS